MANSELYGKTFPVPSDVIKYVQTVLVSNPNGEGVKRAKFIVKNGILTYQELKRLKNFFDTYNPEITDKMQYALAGGNLMKAFVDKTLQAERNAVKGGKEIRRDMNIDPNLATHAYQTPRLSEAEDKDKKEEKQKNAVAVIVNSDNKILLLKRAKIKDIWMPEKWALVGGRIEKGETPQKAVEREITEETGLTIDKFIKTFAIHRNPGSIEHIFACRYDGDPTDITLNEENTNYGWYDIDEMNYLDIVPHLIEYITLSFKKYE
jgi:8-oxo-dGTP pyrophosphatase MutT (NUDIX family)